MTRENLPVAQMEMRQRMAQRKTHKTRVETEDACSIPTKWRYTLTVALRALISKCYQMNHADGCEAALRCAHELGLDVALVRKYTPLEKQGAPR